MPEYVTENKTGLKWSPDPPPDISQWPKRSPKMKSWDGTIKEELEQFGFPREDPKLKVADYPWAIGM